MKLSTQLLQRCRALVNVFAVVASTFVGVEAAAEPAVTGTVPGAQAPTTGRATTEADRLEPLPSRLKGVDVTEHLGASLPKDLVLRNSDGQQVRFGDLFDGKRPVVL